MLNLHISLRGGIVAILFWSCAHVVATGMPVPAAWRVQEPSFMSRATVEGIRDHILAQNTADQRAKAKVAGHVEDFVAALVQSYAQQLSADERADLQADQHVLALSELMREAIDIGAQSWDGETAEALAVLPLSEVRSVLLDLGHRHKAIGLDGNLLKWVLQKLPREFESTGYEIARPEK